MKLKLRLLGLLLLINTAVALAGENFGQRGIVPAHTDFLQKCEKILRREGYRPEKVGNQRLRFKVEGYTYSILNNEDDPGYLKMDISFDGQGVERRTYLNIANSINEERKVVKMYVDDDNDICLTTEILFDQSSELNDILPRLIEMLSGAARTVLEKVEKHL